MKSLNNSNCQHAAGRMAQCIIVDDSVGLEEMCVHIVCVCIWVRMHMVVGCMHKYANCLYAYGCVCIWVRMPMGVHAYGGCMYVCMLYT